MFTVRVRVIVRVTVGMTVRVAVRITVRVTHLREHTPHCGEQTHIAAPDHREVAVVWGLARQIRSFFSELTLKMQETKRQEKDRRTPKMS